MYKPKLIAIGLICCILAGVLLSGCGSGGKEAEELERLKQENELLLQEIDALKQQQALLETQAVQITEENTSDLSDPVHDDTKEASASDFSYVSNGSEVQIDGYLGQGGTVVIPDEIEGVPVTRIAPKAFAGAESITGLILPQNLTFIGGSAFEYLENLGGVIVLPETVAEIEGHAFQCTGITGIVIQSSCELNVNAFANNSKLKFVYVKNGCNPEIKTAVFGYSENLETAVFPASMCAIKDETFERCNQMVIYTPEGSYAKAYADRNFIRTNTEAYDYMASEFESDYGLKTAANEPEIRQIAAKAYDTAINLTINDLRKEVQPFGTSYYYHDVIIHEEDIVFNGAVNQGAIYRSIAKYLSGYTMGINGGASYGERMTGVPYTDKNAFDPYARNALEFIVEKDSLYHIMKKFESLDAVDGTFDFSQANFTFTITDVSDCAAEMMISEEMLGYVIAEVSEYTPEIYFADGGCTINLQANTDFGW